MRLEPAAVQQLLSSKRHFDNIGCRKQLPPKTRPSRRPLHAPAAQAGLRQTLWHFART
jgi:hypothetical protein